MSHDLCDMGASSLDPETNALVAQCKGAPLDVEQDLAPDFGATPMFCALGLTARPYPADENGSAQAVMATDMPGMDGVIVGARDTRTAQVVAELSPGETALHSTGKDFDSRVFCKDQMVALIVGDDLAFVMDRKNKKVTLAAFGLVWEMSAEQGINLSSGGAGVQIKDDAVSIYGTVVLGGRAPNLAQCIMLGPLLGSPGGGGAAPLTAAKGVFIGA